MTFDFNLQLLLQAVLAVFLPLLVAVVTTKVTSGRARGLILALLTLITSFLTELLASLTAGSPFDVFQWLPVALGSFLVSVGFHFGLWGASGPKTPDGEPTPSISAKVIANVGAKQEPSRAG